MAIDVNGTYYTDTDLAEMWNLYHLARAAGCETPHARILWAVREYAKTRTDTTPANIYKAFDRTRTN